VLTASGETRPIKFIGRRKISFERIGPGNGDGPVKISRFAIDGKVPHSDLYVSPAHAIYINGILIPASQLVNGVTIVADAKPEARSFSTLHWTRTKPSLPKVWQCRVFSATTMHSIMQTSMSDCMARPGAFDALCANRLTIAAAKSWHRTSAARLLPRTISANRSKRFATAFSIA
jgi:Hint domain